MKALVTGATGFVGKALIEELLENKIDVVAYVRNSIKIPEKWLKDNGIKIIYGDLNELGMKVYPDLIDEKIDIFFHFGWFGTSGKERADIEGQLQNVRNTCEAVKAGASLGCKTFVNAGSIMEYEVIKLMNSGNYIAGMSNIYSTSKLAADFMARTLANSLSIKYINVIISNIYGIGEESERFLNTTIQKMMKNEEILLTHGNQLYDFIYVTDAVKAILMAGTEGKGNESYYIGNSFQRPLKDFILEMKTVLGSESELKFGAVPLNAPSITYEEFDTKKVEREFGIKSNVTFQEGIKRVKKWMEGNRNE